MNTIIKSKNLCKSRGKQAVIKNVSMNINEGEIYGFLGPNGAGKTTIMKMLLNLVKPTSGDIFIFGEKIKKNSYDYLGRIGSIIEYPVFYNKLTVVENLKLHCEYLGITDYLLIDWALDTMGLKEIRQKKASELSLGMKQRLGIARAIISKPKLLILDEPINGLDPLGIKDVRELLLKLKKKFNITILISSHIISEIESIADTIGIIDNGNLIKEVKMDDIIKGNLEYMELEVDNTKKAILVLEKALQIKKYETKKNTLKIYDKNISQKEVNKELINNGLDVIGSVKKHITLEEYFINNIKQWKEGNKIG
ncbi:ABC transporter ATP-binding protein [Clostridium estertheticum]|uniref:ABC transporter ATP-binding protein n=1 Tax=Clostridium estertheticum TaxID=238834 RepID=UPI001C0E1F0D|nr:ATP-binding cassette domain-containing protein [Clostridium estertheticum]MBU3173572.1 ATP-binding cassette domain-containing protein [Clostridium estertheticum]MBX4261329.1 ATP-binding cassette domain-containing protein [Clostridium estertheticum]MCB2338794.1 ATP-binding cassette domain-containing protein [Clostridium estertheticum]WLC70698.1 ATP-binding cassette domain-containing protein [Clostridium estertheticum]